MPAAQNAQILRCQNCGANNRINKSQTSEKTPICGRCKAPLSAKAHPITVTDGNYIAEIENSLLPVLLDLWAPWCGPCRMLAPIIDQIAGETAGRIRVGKLNVDENPNTASRFRVQGIPTLLFLKNGKEIDRIVGAKSKEAILSRLQAIM